MSELNELMILFMSWVVACGKLNFLFCITDNLIAITLGWSQLVSIIFPTVVSSREGFADYRNEDGLLPEDFSTIIDTMLVKIFCEDFFITS